MAKTQILEYTIWLTDQGLVDAYNAALDAGTGPGSPLIQYYSPATQGLVRAILRAPGGTGAQIEFSAPLQTDDEPFLAPCIRSPWFTNGANFPVDVATFTRKSGGWFGIPILFGQTTKFYWAGRFAWAAPSVDSPEPPPTPPPVLASRRWVDGSELGLVGSVETGEGGSAGLSFPGREASRVHDGFGYRRRDQTSSQRAHTVMENRGGGASDQKASWERFYVNARRYTSVGGEVDIWFGADQSSNGTKLRMAADGRLLLYRWVNNAATLVGTGPIVPLNTRQKFDVVVGYRGITPAWATDAPCGNGPGNSYEVGQWVVRSLNNYRCIIQTCTILPTPNQNADNDPLNFSGDPYWAIESTTAGRLGSFRLYINGVQVMNFDGFSLIAGTTTSENFHTTSTLGAPTGQANDAEIDYDSWISVDCPVVQQPWDGAGSDLDDYPDYATLESQSDFQSGTHCQLVALSGVTSQVNWTGDWRLALKPLVDNLDTANRITSSVSGALLELTGDVSPTYLRQGAMGVGAVVVGVCYIRGAGTVGNDTVGGELSLDTDGDGVPDLSPSFSASVVPGSANVTTWRHAFYDAAGLDPAPKLTAMALRFTHGADVIARNIEAVAAVVELIGTFGVEDLPPGSIEDVPVFVEPDPHFSNQPFSPWALTTGPRFGVAAIICGTYVGTGNPGLEITLPLPPAFIWIRRTSGTAAQMEGYKWWPSMYTGHLTVNQPISPWVSDGSRRDPTFPPAPAEDDQEEQWLFRINTANDKVNAAGVTYAYSIVCDPAARYVRCGAGFHESGFPVADILPDPNFTPEAAFFWLEDLGNTSTPTVSYKGPEHAAGESSLLTGTLQTNYANFAQGQLIHLANMSPSGIEEAAYALFRLDDGNGQAPIFQHASYVGDGTGNRTIDLTPLFGVRPAFGIVVGSGTSSDRYRDVGHTGTTSTDTSSGTLVAANGIRGGGIDQILVGSDLNALGVTYYVFVLPGDDTACENGWACPGTYYVSEPDSPFDPGWEEPTEIEPGGGDDVPSIPPIDFSQPERLRLTYIDRMVYFDYADTEGDGRTLIFEPLYKRWSFDVYPSGVSCRYAEPGPQVHTNLIGCYNGQIYQFEESVRTDDGTGIPWILWPMWAGGDDPRGLKQWGDAIVDLTPGGGCLITPVAANGGILSATVVAASATRRTQIVEVNAGDGVIARNFGLRISGTQNAADPSRPFLYAWEPSWLPKDVSVERRATDWDDLGYKGAKFVQGVVIRANTFNLTKSVDVQYDGGTVAETLELLHNGEQTIAYPIDPYGWTPFIAELVRLKGADTVPWSLLDWRWVWEPAPEAATQWETQETTFNLPGFLSVHDCLIAYMADDPVTLTVWHDDDVQMHTLPATAGVYLRYYQRLSAAKGKWARFRLTSDAPFRLFARDTSVRVQGWGIPGGYQVTQPFGGPHREVGAQI